MKKNTPENIKQDFYNKYSEIKNYKELKIKNNNITKQLKEIFNNNVWNLKMNVEGLNEKQEIEHNNFYNAFLSDVYLLDFSNNPNIKKEYTIKDFYEYKFKDEGNTKRTEENYINTFKSWGNSIFKKELKDEKTFKYIVLNQNEVFLKLLQYRNENNNSLETLRKDLNLLMKLLKLYFGERSEIVNKYKVVNITLSKIYEFEQKTNKLTKVEEQKFINYVDLLKIRDELYNKWELEYENTTLDKYKNNILRIQNIKALLLSFYLYFPPLRMEAPKIKIIKNESEADKHEAAILIKNKNNVIIYLNEKKKGHKPIKYNLNDKVIKSFMGNKPQELINLIIESVNTYPREFLFINSSDLTYTEDGIKKMFKSIHNKLGVNVLRSSYVSYWLPKLNKLQAERVAFLMRSSVGTAETHYLKQVEEIKEQEQEEEPKQQIKNKNENVIKTEEKEIKEQNKGKLTDLERDEKHEQQKKIMREYYKNNQAKINKMNTSHSKETYYKRLVRELNNNVKNIENVRETTLEKWKIKYNNENNKYYSELEK